MTRPRPGQGLPAFSVSRVSVVSASLPDTLNPKPTPHTRAVPRARPGCGCGARGAGGADRTRARRRVSLRSIMEMVRFHITVYKIIGPWSSDRAVGHVQSLAAPKLHSTCHIEIRLHIEVKARAPRPYAVPWNALSQNRSFLNASRGHHGVRNASDVK